MLKRFNPDGMAPPLSGYSHGVVVAQGMRQLHVAGQVGLGPDGSLPADVAQQARNCFANVLAILAAENMAADDLVSLTTYVVGEENLPAIRAARMETLGDLAPASTLVFVTALAAPGFKVEIQAVAASTA